MRWPDIFFKARKMAPVEPTPPPPFKPAITNPKRALAETPLTDANPDPIQPEPETETNPPLIDPAQTRLPAHPLPEETGPGPRPAVRTVPPLVEQATQPAPSTTGSDAIRATDEADPLPALSLSGSLRLSKPLHLEAQPHAGPIILKSEPAPLRESVSSPTPEPGASVSSPITPPPQPEKPAQADASVESVENESTWKETSFIVPPGDVSPATSISTGMISIRRKAKLTDVARIIAPPPLQPAEPEPSAPKSESSATVIPPAFTVAAPAPATAEKLRTISPEPETTKPSPITAPIPIESTGPTPDPSEKKEFLLANGERILGRVLSETAETIYLDHGTLGVLTLPRAQIAQRPVEIILINGDRIVGDIMAETPDTLYVRHASLGMLTVPRAQRSTRVVEAILTDGDRILGEVLAETETLTVIRSATLGTVSVPHDKVAMLNRKIEQIELKALPPTAPQLKDKPAE